MDLFDLYAKITLDTSDYSKGINDAQGKASSFASKIGGGLKAAAKVGAAGVTAAATGIAALTGKAVKNYAEYEQLVGGVETLFKDSSDAIIGYANKAYKTAGMSANEYMETVTSFSASLLQSLGGDTVAAAEYADQAIIDMSDNANKMGTDMTMIQNAYQGFAKQNYTMLDNLKLGYGGTKTEMERLIADANRVKEANGEMADLSIDSFADVTEAIHIIQSEMGITGTTAEEASSTIEGSVNSMKSAWTNLTTGIADENANIDDLLDKFIDSVETTGSNLLPVVGRVLSNLGTKIEENFPKIVSKGVEMLVKLGVGIIEGIPKLILNIPKVIDAIIDGFKKADMDWIQIGKDLIMGVWDGIKSLGGWLFGKVKGFFHNLFNDTKEEEEIHSPSKKWARIGRDMARGVGVGFENEYSTVSGKMGENVQFDTKSVKFKDSSVGIASANMIGATVATQEPAGGGEYTINLNLDGNTIATVMFDPLRGVVKQRGVGLA